MTNLVMARPGFDVAESGGEREGAMPLPWVRLDTAFPWNQKLLAMLGEKDGHRAAVAYICSLAYSGGQGTDGFISRESLPHVHCRLSDAARLVKHEFWEEQPGGWLIHDWAEFQQSNAETQERSRRARKNANARWDGHIAQSDAERARNSRARRRQGDVEKEG